MRNFKGLAHIGLHTADIEASKKFYVENLGFQFDYEITLEKPDNAWTKLAFVHLNGMIIEFIQPSDSAIIKSGNAGCVDHFTIEVENLPAVVADLKAKGIVFETEEPLNNAVLYGGTRMIFFRGPSGERLELFEFMKK